MTNEQVITQFLKGQLGHSLHLYTEGSILINYNTRIAYVENNKLYLNKTKYSRTTSKIQSQLRRLAPMYYKNIEEYEGDNYGRNINE